MTALVTPRLMAAVPGRSRAPRRRLADRLRLPLAVALAVLGIALFTEEFNLPAPAIAAGIWLIGLSILSLLGRYLHGAIKRDREIFVTQGTLLPWRTYLAFTIPTAIVAAIGWIAYRFAADSSLVQSAALGLTVLALGLFVILFGVQTVVLANAWLTVRRRRTQR